MFPLKGLFHFEGKQTTDSEMLRSECRVFEFERNTSAHRHCITVMAHLYFSDYRNTVALNEFIGLKYFQLLE